ncbi:uncharacterized protein [Solanum tuberosum]|uniref:uncharacterized protein n=1 Tax=Solanum tuberosum TaxID=4113 RepID=UPI00073A4B86|nr:PREDICTED: uncharacterized protein LOC107062778 [Solanum tuberosum]
MECITTISYSFVLNEGLTKSFLGFEARKQYLRHLSRRPISRLERFGGIEERKGIGEVACLTSILRWSECISVLDSPSALAILQHIRFQGELFIPARVGFSWSWHNVLSFRT